MVKDFRELFSSLLNVKPILDTSFSVPNTLSPAVSRASLFFNGRSKCDPPSSGLGF